MRYSVREKRGGLERSGEAHLDACAEGVFPLAPVVELALDHPPETAPELWLRRVRLMPKRGGCGGGGEGCSSTLPS